MAKFIICDCARANWGKTTTLVEVINLFKSTPVRFSVIATTSVPTPDQWFVFHDAVTSKDILIQTAGDNSGCFTDTKNYLKSGKCVEDPRGLVEVCYSCCVNPIDGIML